MLNQQYTIVQCVYSNVATVFFAYIMMRKCIKEQGTISMYNKWKAQVPPVYLRVYQEASMATMVFVKTVKTNYDNKSAELCVSCTLHTHTLTCTLGQQAKSSMRNERHSSGEAYDDNWNRFCRSSDYLPAFCETLV